VNGKKIAIQGFLTMEFVSNNPNLNEYVLLIRSNSVWRKVSRTVLELLFFIISLALIQKNPSLHQNNLDGMMGFSITTPTLVFAYRPMAAE